MTDFEAGRPRVPYIKGSCRANEHDAEGKNCPQQKDAHGDELEHWIRCIASGDTASLGYLYDATIGRCYALALRIVRDPHAAEDICEDVFLQVWRDAIQFDASRGNAYAWLVTICRSRSLDYLRRRKQEDVRDDVETLLPIDTTQDPFDLLLAVRASSSVARALEQLTAPQRQVIGLAFYRGMSQQEIAEHMSMPLGTVKSNARRALATLRSALAPDFA